MPEAVIVSTARTPIGRAFKGSLKDVRPDDLAAAVSGRPRQGPGARPGHASTTSTSGCAEPSGRARLQHGPRRRRARRLRPPARAPPINRFCASSVQTTRMAFHAIKAGEGDVFISRRRRVRLPYVDFAGAGGAKADGQNPLFADAEARSAADGREQRDLDRPARGRPAARRLHRDGPDRRERRDLARHLPRAPGRVGRHAARTAPRRPSPTGSSTARSRRSPRRTAPSSARDDGPRAGRHPRGRRRA